MKLRVIAWLIIILGMLLCRAAFLEDVIYNIDEAEYAVAADALDHGWLPGVDLLGSTKPPAIAILYNLLFHIFDRTMAVIHWAHLVIVIFSGLLVIELAVAIFGVSAAIPAAVLFWMVSNTFNLPSEMLALNVESPGMLLILGALLIVWKYSANRGPVLVAGVLAGTAIMFRQSTALFLLSLGYLILASTRPRWKQLIAAGIGIFIPWIPIFIIYSKAGGIGWAWDSWVRYPITYAGDVGFLGLIQAFYMNTGEFAVQATVPLALAIGGGIVLWRNRTERASRFVMILLVASIVALFSGSRFFGHYWIQIYPVFALLGIPAWLSLWRGKTFPNKGLLIGAIIIGGLVAGLHFPTWRRWDPGAPPPGVGHYAMTDQSLEIETGAFAKAHTTSDETIAVWGYCPQIYYYAGRLPGVRDYLCHYITGYSPGSFDPFSQRAFRQSGHLMAEAMFLEDLQQHRPKYIFDLVQVSNYVFTFQKYSLRTYPQVAEYVTQNYLPEGQIGEVLIYRRRTPEDTWWPSPDDIE
ncbi:MAG: ArnT family glycosyltransferase [Calditrichota bacterium]